MLDRSRIPGRVVLQTLQHILRQRLGFAQFSLFVAGSADANAKEQIFFQHIECAADATADPKSFVAEAVHLLRFRCFFALFLATLARRRLLRLFFFSLLVLIVTFTRFFAERAFPEISWIRRTRGVLGSRHVDYH